jgi:UDP-N-acetylmuramoyl-tripeptide--D-alanyl-D-alanine ligase
MSVLTASEIAAKCGGRVDGDARARVDAWEFDSRRLAPGSCFVALRDARDGHDFVGAAFAAGAAVAIVDRAVVDAPPGRALVHVTDTLRALQDVAQSVRADRTDLDVVAVAGSTGKTSTKDLLAATLTPRGVHANAESFNNEFGLPLTLLNAPGSVRVVVTEMGERNPGDLALLCDIARPRVGVITNVGLAHAEYLGGHEGAADTLAELLNALPADGVAVLNADDPWSERLATRTEANVVTVGTAEGAMYRVEDVTLDERVRPSFSIAGHRFQVPLHGGHHAANAAAAIATAHHVFGMAWDEIATELAGTASGRWRMELIDTDDGITVCNDAYNANPSSMEAALVALAHLPVPGRRIAVLGEMRELGVHSEGAHRDIGVRAAELELDLVVGVGEGGAAIAVAARDAGARVALAADAGAALDLVDATAQSGDAVLCKASRAVGLESVAEELVARHRAGARGGAA